MLCAGRFLCGIAAGHANIIMSVSINETVPNRVLHQFESLVHLYTCIGIMFSLFLGCILPTDEDQYADDEMWRVVYIMPALFAIIQIVMYLTIF